MGLLALVAAAIAGGAASLSSSSNAAASSPNQPAAPPLQEGGFVAEMCGEAPSWSLFDNGALTPCFVHVFLYGPLYLAFVICATIRLRQVVSLPMPAPRPLSLYQVSTITLSSLIAGYNLVLFAVLCAFDFGRPYQWFLYPVGCLTWFYCVIVLIAEAKYGMQTHWVLRAFWIFSCLFAFIQLYAFIEAPAVTSTPFFTAFLIHLALFVASAVAALWTKESQTSYAQLPLDFNELTFDEEQIAAGGPMMGGMGGGMGGGVGGLKGMMMGSGDANNEGGMSMGGIGGVASSSSSRPPARRIAMLFRREKWLLSAGLMCCLIGAPIEVVQFIYVGLILDDVAVPEGPTAFTEYVGVLVMLYILEAVASGIQLVLFMIAGERMACRLRRTLHTAVLRQDVSFLEAPGRPKEIVRRLDEDVSCIQEAQTVHLPMWLQSMMQVLVGSAFLFVLTWKLSLVSLAVVPFVGLMMLAQATVMQSFSKRTLDWLVRVEDMGREIIAGIQTVRTFSRENREKSRYGAEVMESNRISKRMAVAHGVSEGAGVFVLKMCAVLGIFYGGSLVHHHELSGGVLISFIFISLQVVMASTVVPPLIGRMSQSMQAGQRVFELLDRKPDMNTRGGLSLPSLEGRIEFKDVTFYSPHRPSLPVLSHLSLLIESGQKVSICGPLGSGKSTILSLIQRLYSPSSGLVLLDDTDIASFDPSFITSQISLVSHDPILFSSYTISENISYGLDKKQDEIQNVAEMVGLHDLLKNLPGGGYRAIVGGGGVRLDRGQRQRIIIARVLLRNPKILLLDEPTLGLSPDAEMHVTQALTRASKGKTVVSVVSKLASARDSDFIVVLRRGGVEEMGEHLELIQRGNGVYRAMWERETPLENADWAEEDELAGKIPLPTSGGGGGGGGGGKGGGGGGGGNSRVLELVDDLEREISKMKPGSGAIGGSITGEAFSSLAHNISLLRSLAVN